MVRPTIRPIDVSVAYGFILMPTTAVQVRLSEQGGGTRMELRFKFDSSEHMEQLERLGAFEVFPQSVGQMDALLAAENPPKEVL